MDRDKRKELAFREAFPDDTEPRGWAEHYFEVGYEAGRRAERERIHHDLQNLGKSEYGSCYADYAQAIDRYIDELRTEPAESGE